MKKLFQVILCAALLSMLALSTFAQGTAFTYQGRLNDAQSPASGIYDLRFELFDAVTLGAQHGTALTNSTTAVSNGLFAVTLDFGNQFPGAERWLEIAVRTNGGGTFVTLSPRQQIPSTPYAITAGNVAAGGLAAGTYGSVVTLSNAANVFLGSYTGNGGGLTNVNAVALGGITADGFWRLGGNPAGAGQFLGTTNNQSLELRANNLPVLRLEPDPRIATYAANLIGGYTNNVVEKPGSGGNVVAGGGYVFGVNVVRSNSSGNFIGAGSRNEIGPNVNDSAVGAGFGNTIRAAQSVIGGGEQNTIQPLADHSFIGGGARNTIQTNAPHTTIGGGTGNTILAEANFATIGGGASNLIQANGLFATLGGGEQNAILAGGSHATLGGGRSNTTGGTYATVPGGFQNVALGDASLAAGRQAKAFHPGSFVWADSTEADFASLAPNQFSVRAGGGVRLVTGGTGLTVDGQPVATTNAALLNASQTFSGLNTFNNSVGVNGSLSVNTIAPAGTLTIAGDIAMSGGATTYHNLSLSGGNSAGFLYGSFPALGDGIHLGYNWYADNAGAGHVINPGGATSRISTGYGEVVLAVGGVNTAPNAVRLYATTAGVSVYGTFNNFSDREAKQNFRPVNPVAILDKVARLPLSAWSYKIDPATRHIGPMAQDFHAAFAVGTDERHIAPIDEGGVALAAIQGLNQKVEAGSQRSEVRCRILEEQLQAKATEIAGLKTRLEKLEQIVNQKFGDAQ